MVDAGKFDEPGTGDALGQFPGLANGNDQVTGPVQDERWDLDTREDRPPADLVAELHQGPGGTRGDGRACEAKVGILRLLVVEETRGPEGDPDAFGAPF